MTCPTPWCLTYRYPMPPGATRPAPKPEAAPARTPPGFRTPTGEALDRLFLSGPGWTERGDRPR